MGMFGGMAARIGVGGGFGGGRAGSIAGFEPRSTSLLDKIGLVGDIFTGNPVTKTRLDEDSAFQQAQYQAQHPAPIKVGEGETFIDPLTGKTVFSGPPKLPAIAQNAAYLDSVTPGLGNTYAANFANNGGGQGPAVLTVNGQQMMRAPGAAAAPSIHPEAIARLRANPHEAALFDQQFGPGSAARVLGTGGAAPQAPAPFRAMPAPLAR